jgi:beta-xylosidase
VFPFGHGLSYAPVTWCGVARRSPEAWPADGYCQVSVSLRNDAAIAATEMIQVYLHDPVAEVARPVQQLIARWSCGSARRARTSGRCSR